MLATLTLRETDCYSWHDSMVRHTLADAAPSRAKPFTLGSLSPETNLPASLQLIVLCAVESFPGADGLLCGQRSYGTIQPHYIRPLLFQNYINALRQFARHGHDGFARGHLLGMALIDAAIESPQLRIFLDRGPGALNQLIAQPAVARVGNRAAIFLFAGRVFAGDDPEEAGNLLPIFDLLRVAQTCHQMRTDNPPNARQTQQQIDGLLQLCILEAVATNLFGGGGRGLKMEVQRVEQIIQLKSHRLRTRQSLQLAHCPRRPFLLRVRKRDRFVKQQRLDAQLTGAQLPHMRVAQLHQMAQIAIGACRHVNAAQLSTAQAFRKLPAIESVGL